LSAIHLFICQVFFGERKCSQKPAGVYCLGGPVLCVRAMAAPGRSQAVDERMTADNEAGQVGIVNITIRLFLTSTLPATNSR